MNGEHTVASAAKQLPVLPVEPPFVWPEPRWHTGQGRYEPSPPFEPLVAEADLLGGVLVGVADGTVRWLQSMIEQDEKRGMHLVVLVYPGGPTQEEHLLALGMLQTAAKEEQQKVEIRVLPTRRTVSANDEKMVLPPTLLLANNSQAEKTWLCVGSVGDAGHDTPKLFSFNAVFQPDALLCDQWLRWFQHLFERAAPLTAETVRIPALLPSIGDPAAEVLWAEFEKACVVAGTGVSRQSLDQETGEAITDSDAPPTELWDGGKLQLDPLAQKLQQIYASGWLLTVDESTRIKPLEIPVKATLLGQQAARAIGSVIHKQAFSLEVLAADVAKNLNKCRLITDLVELITYLLGKGCHWLPASARPLLERELERRNSEGRDALKGALGGASVADFILSRRERIRRDLDAMYRELRQGDHVPSDKLTTVLNDVENRLSAALAGRFTPKPVYNKLQPPNLAHASPDENWSQPLSLILRAARLLREALTDPFFPRRLSGLCFDQQQFLAAMNIFNDGIVTSDDNQRAKDELATLAEIEQGDRTNKEKCHAVWQVIVGGKRRI